MSADAKLKTFPVNGQGEYALPFSVDAVADLMVFNSYKDRETILTSGQDYVPVSSGGSVTGIQTLKEFCGFISVACVPCVDVDLRKFGVQMLPDLNATFRRIADRMAYLEARLAHAVSVPIGFPAPVSLVDGRPARDYGRRDVKLYPNATIDDFGDFINYQLSEQSQPVDCYVQFGGGVEASGRVCFLQYSRDDACCAHDFGPWVQEVPKPVWVANASVCDFGLRPPLEYNLSVKGCCDEHSNDTD